MPIQSLNSQNSLSLISVSKGICERPRVFSYHDLLSIQNQNYKKQIDPLLEFSQISSSQNFSAALGILVRKDVNKVTNGDHCTCPPQDIEPLHQIFDDQGRVIQIISSDSTINYKLSYEGDVTKIANQVTGEILVQEFDDQGRLIREVFPHGLEISWTFDGEFLSEVTLPDQSKVVYQHIDADHINIRRLNPNNEVQYQHEYETENGIVTKEALIGKAGALQRRYDEIEKIFTSQSTFLYVVDHYDEDRNLTSRTFKDPLVKNVSTRFDYPIGDLLASEKRQLDDLGRVIYYNGYTCSYDEKGRLVQKSSQSQTTSYEYDAFDRLISADVGDKKIEYTYDLSGRRLSKTVRKDGQAHKEFYVYQSLNQIGVYNEKKEPLHLRVLGVHSFSHLPLAIAVESQGNVYAPIHSSSFNIFQLIDKDSSEVVHYESLNPFGENLQDLNPICPWVFATKHFDSDTGLIDFGDRQYDPSIKQWTSADPDPRAVEDATYSYCNNNPLKFIDPNGNFAIFIPLTQGLWAAGAAILTGIGAWAAKKGADHINEERERKKAGKKPPYDWNDLGDDPTKCPKPGFEWKGNGPPGSGKGSWDNGTEQLYPDLNHPGPIGPHWDYRGPNFPGKGIRIKPNGWEYKSP